MIAFKQPNRLGTIPPNSVPKAQLVLASLKNLVKLLGENNEVANDLASLVMELLSAELPMFGTALLLQRAQGIMSASRP